MVSNPSIAARHDRLTPHLRLDELLVEHAHALQRASARNFVGMYLIGSLAVGDFDATSDVDFIIVTNEELGSDELVAVGAARTRRSVADTSRVLLLPDGEAPDPVVAIRGDQSESPR